MEKYQNANIVLHKSPTTAREKVDPQTINDDIQDKDNWICVNIQKYNNQFL